MAENKFIAQLKGNTAPGSVLEIQDKGSKTSFANMPSGTSDAFVTYSDKRNNATAVLKGAMNWKVNGSTLSVANPAGDGSDYTGQTDVSGISDQQGNNLWINASYTVPAGGLFLTKNTKWVLKLCGDNLIVNGGDTAEFTVLITAGNSTNITKKFFVGEQANQFCKELVIDFAESNISGVKLEQGDSISLKLLCDITNASARIYQGMTTLTLLQRAVDAENVISNAGSFEEVVDDINYLENHIIVKSATMPTASADLLGEVYQYNGATAYPYEHGYIYECVAGDPYYEANIAFAPSTFASEDFYKAGKLIVDAGVANPEEVASISMTYALAGNLWSIVFKDAEDNALNTAYSVYTEDLEQDYDILPVIDPSEFVDGQVVTGTVNNIVEHRDYSWQRMDVQPGGSRGRFLSLWNCATGLAVTNPPISPYEYKAGDYFIVSNVSSGTNYKPSGTEYVIGTPSTAVETEDVFVDDTYFFDGTSWKLQNTSNDIKDLVDTKVSKDGSSIMSGPLKFRAGSFEGAIAGGLGDGISVYKMNADGSINSEVAALTKTNGFIPGTTNSMNIGSSSLKWKDAYIGRVISGVLNNGADINVPTTAGTLALKSDIGIGINNISNCITEIPQDINLELNNGTLTLKSGSVLYKGDGSFTQVTLANDISTTPTPSDGKRIILTNGANYLDTIAVDAWVSGSTEPTSASLLWFNTTNNKIYNGGPGNWNVASNLCLPLGVVTVSGNQIVSIDQVFNGFGFMGSTIFMLPGVTLVKPNGHNVDGSLKNIVSTTTSVKTNTTNRPSTNGYLIYAPVGQAIQKSAAKTNWYYDERRNFVSSLGGDTSWMIWGSYTTDANDKIISFEPKTTFHAVDYSDFIAADAQNVKLSGNQDIAGEKKFTDGVIYVGDKTRYQSTNIEFFPSNTATNGGYIDFHYAGSSADYTSRLIENASGSLKAITPNGFSVSVSPAASDNSTQVATTAWVQGHGILIDSQMPTADNNYTWYRKYSDGWVEQGGWVAGTSAVTDTLTLLVEMADTKYYASVTNTSSNTGDPANLANISVWNRTTTSFDFRKQPSDTYWFVCGMAAN